MAPFLLLLTTAAFCLPQKSVRPSVMSFLATPLDFVFKGYSIWLELEQVENDLDKALEAAAVDLDVDVIPEPHVTAIYGMTHLTETQVLQHFRESLIPKVQSWPELRVQGFKVDKSFDGINGQEMDMAWMEIEFETSEAHEELVDIVHNAFCRDGVRVRPWQPHVSIAYENPDVAKVNLDFAMEFVKQFPLLITQSTRQVTAVSVWKTEGKMAEWKCLDRHKLSKSAVEQLNPAR
jgi:hypothetical protein